MDFVNENSWLRIFYTKDWVESFIYDISQVFKYVWNMYLVDKTQTWGFKRPYLYFSCIVLWNKSVGIETWPKLADPKFCDHNYTHYSLHNKMDNEAIKFERCATSSRLTMKINGNLHVYTCTHTSTRLRLRRFTYTYQKYSYSIQLYYYNE